MVYYLKTPKGEKIEGLVYDILQVNQTGNSAIMQLHDGEMGVLEYEVNPIPVGPLCERSAFFFIDKDVKPPKILGIKNRAHSYVTAPGYEIIEETVKDE